MNGLYPIIRRVRRPLLPVEEVAAPRVAMGSMPEESKEVPVVETRQKEPAVVEQEAKVTESGDSNTPLPVVPETHELVSLADVQVVETVAVPAAAEPELKLVAEKEVVPATPKKSRSKKSDESHQY